MNQSSMKLPKASEFERALARELDEAKANEPDGATAREIVRRAADRYNDLHAERKRYENRALEHHFLREGRRRKQQAGRDKGDRPQAKRRATTSQGMHVRLPCSRIIT